MTAGGGSSIAEAPGTRRSAAVRRRDAHYLRTAIAISAAVFVGFWFTYFGPGLSGDYPETALAVHLHGWSFFAWYLLFPLQAALVHTRRVSLHRTLGMVSVALATIMVGGGLLVVSVQMANAATSAEPTFWSIFGPMIFATLALFSGFYVVAIALRRRPAHHKRFMVVASAAGAGAAASRIVTATFGPVSWAAPMGILGTNVFILGAMAYDQLREHRIHSAYWVGLGVCVAVEAGIWLLTPMAPGRMVSAGLAWLGRTFGGLY